MIDITPKRLFYNSAFITVAISLLVALASVHARADTQINCQLTPQEIIQSVRVSDPVVSLQRAGKALEKCDNTRYLDLQVDRKTLDIPLSVAKIEQLTGTWVSDMWLHVEEGVTPAIGEILSIKNGRIEQGFVRWNDPDGQKNPTYLAAYVPRIATARLQSSQDGVKITAFVPSSHDSIHNPYRAMSGSEPNRLQRQLIAAVSIHIGKITRVLGHGDRLLLVDSRGIVRTYRRHTVDIVLVSHRFFFAANINARAWPCVLGVMSRQVADKATQDQAIILVARSPAIHSLQKAITKIGIDLEKLKPQSQKALSLVKERAEYSVELRSLLDADFQNFTSQFDDPNQLPGYCLQK